MTYQVPFLLLTDGYKVDHRRQYPKGTRKVFSNLTPRNGRDPRDTGVIFFGLRAALKEYFVDYVNETFFSRPVDEVCAEYELAMLNYLGPNEIGSDHIRALHALGYLPLRFDAVAEGTLIPYGVPVLTVENTVEEFFWVTNYIETLLSSLLWNATTSATTAFKYRVLLEGWAEATGSPQEFVDWQGHDFSFRGMSSPQTAVYSGMGHLTSFTGTDTIPAIHYLSHYYEAEGLIGGSVAATEHSVMCASGVMDNVESEIELFRRLLNDVYKTGILSVVSDTRDFWEVLGIVVPALKSDILARDGKLVIRPDSGDPVKIVCGDPDAPVGSPEYKGAVEVLWDIFGGTETSTGHLILNGHIGVIYGDSITLDRANEICFRLAEKGFASANMVFGIGSFTYQFVTRDSHGFAIKATWSLGEGGEHQLFKEPKTDDGKKKSAKGRTSVVLNDAGVPTLVDKLDHKAWVQQGVAGTDLLKAVWRNGYVTAYGEAQTLASIRANVKAEVAKARISDKVSETG